jgi:hypothetical protein
MASFPDAVSMVEALREAYSDRPALVHLAGAALADATPHVIEGEVAAPGCWVHDGTDIRGYVGPDALREEVIAGLCPTDSPMAIAVRSAAPDGTVTVRAFDREALLCVSVLRVTNRLQEWRWWSEAPDAHVTSVRQRLRRPPG